MFISKMINFTTFLLAGMAVALPEPHVSMIDNANVRDVGMTYNKENFQGASKFVLQFKQDTQCLDLYASL